MTAANRATMIQTATARTPEAAGMDSRKLPHEARLGIAGDLRQRRGACAVLANVGSLGLPDCEAIGHWPETATAVAARLTAGGRCEIAAPCGRPDAGEKRGVYLDRIQSKRWLAVWPRLRIAA